MRTSPTRRLLVAQEEERRIEALAVCAQRRATGSCDPTVAQWISQAQGRCPKLNVVFSGSFLHGADDLLSGPALLRLELGNDGLDVGNDTQCCDHDVLQVCVRVDELNLVGHTISCEERLVFVEIGRWYTTGILLVALETGTIRMIVDFEFAGEGKFDGSCIVGRALCRLGH